MAWQWHRRWTWSFLYWRWRWCQQEQFFENNRRFDASRWGGGSDGHLYDFVKRGFQPSRWASGSDGHLYDFAKRLARKIQRKIQIQSKKTKWPLARLDLSTIFSRVLFEHADGNDESPCWLKMRISFQPWRFCSKVPLSDILAFLITLAKKGLTHQGGEGARMDTSMILPKGAKVLKSFVSLPLLQKNH